MAEIDAFATDLLEEAKRFLEKATDPDGPVAEQAYLHAALMLSFCSFEAHLNAICDEMSERPGVTLHEKGLLLERDVRLESGEFHLRSLRMVRLEDRFQFVHARFSGAPIDRTASWWSNLASAISLRNELTHPKDVPLITKASVSRAIQSIVDALNALYQAVYKRKFPASDRGLTSKMTF